MRLDLAAGMNKQQGFIGVDIVPLPEIDIIHDLERYPWPFEDNSVEEIFCSHYVEHVFDLIKFMDECYRILIPEGKVMIICPYYTSMRASQDPTHKRLISEASFLYFNKSWMKANKLEHYEIKSDFDFTYGYLIAPDWISKNEEARAFAIRHYWNVVTDLQIVLTKRG